MKEIKYCIQKAEKHFKNKETEKGLEQLDFALEKIKKIARENNIENVYDFEIDVKEIFKSYEYHTVYNRPSKNKALKLLAFIKSYKKVFKDLDLEIEEGKALAFYASNEKEKAIELLMSYINENIANVSTYVKLLKMYELEKRKQEATLLIKELEEFIKEENASIKVQGYKAITSYYNVIGDGVNQKKYNKKLNTSVKGLDKLL